MTSRLEARDSRTAAAPPSSSRRWRNRWPAEGRASATASGNDRAQMIEIALDERLRPAPARPRRPARAHDGSATIASTWRSTRSVNFSPRAGEHLDAVVFERIVRRGDHDAGVVIGTARQVGHAGVGTTPALVTSAPLAARRARARASIQSPDSRVSRPTSTRGDCRLRGSARTSAAPSRRTVGGSSGYLPAVPRTPSVPNSRGGRCVSLWPTGICTCTAAGHAPPALPCVDRRAPAACIVAGAETATSTKARIALRRDAADSVRRLPLTVTVDRRRHNGRARRRVRPGSAQRDGHGPRTRRSTRRRQDLRPSRPRTR